MSLGIGQILLILVIVLIIFGAGKLPHVMKDLAKGLKAFKDGLQTDDEPQLPVKASKPRKSLTAKHSKKTIPH
jgi:sec-independent protein translocase protein TatA